MIDSFANKLVQYLPARTLFRYSGGQRFIRLTERFNDEEKTIHRCLVLDEQLSVISRKQKQQQLFGKAKENDFVDERIYFRIGEGERKYYFQKRYEKYEGLQNFEVGREDWGRVENTLKISNNAISREHTRLHYSNEKKREQGIGKVLRIIMSRARISSNWRGLSAELQKKIVEYMVEKPYYYFYDCGSRNGTYLMDRLSPMCELRMGVDYQFENESYHVRVRQMIESSGSRIDEVMRQQEGNWSEPCSKYYFARKYVFPDNINRENLKQNGQTLYALFLEIDVSRQVKFYYWIVNTSEGRQYSVGEGQTLNIVNNEQEEIHVNFNKHGQVSFESGRWFIAGADSGERMWVRVAPKRKCRIDHRQPLVMRIGHLIILQFQFVNY